MKKILLFLSLSIIIVILSACSQKQSDIEEFTTKETEVTETKIEATTKAEVIEYDKTISNEEEQDSTVKIDSFEEEKDKVKKSLDSMEFIPKNLELVQVFDEVDFVQPIHFTYDYEDSPYIYIIEKQGFIKRIKLSNSAENNIISNPIEIFMDLTQLVDSSENEKGLLGMAFHPDFPEDPRFFLYYTDYNSAKIVSYEVSKTDIENDYVPALDTKVEILEYDEPYVNHNGGHIVFGADGYLYIGSGDGGSRGDPDNNAQNLTNLLGKILRIDINDQSTDKKYSIPSDNPFAANSSYMGEIFAYGLRNPWKFSFDKYRNLLIVADVGQDAIEEIDIIENGGNYGWSGLEGTKSYNNEITFESDPIAPIYEYSHEEGKSITGGYTYYGEVLTSLYGVYVYGDFVSGNIWGLWIDQNNQVENKLLLSTNIKISSFGIDANQELYIVDYSGRIYQLKELE